MGRERPFARAARGLDRYRSWSWSSPWSGRVVGVGEERKRLARVSPQLSYRRRPCPIVRWRARSQLAERATQGRSDECVGPKRLVTVVNNCQLLEKAAYSCSFLSLPSSCTCSFFFPTTRHVAPRARTRTSTTSSILHKKWSPSETAPGTSAPPSAAA